MMALSAVSVGDTVYYGGRKYSDATVTTNSEFLSIVHDGGIKRIPWDKVPRRLKQKYPQPAPKPAPKPVTPEAEPAGEKPKASGRNRERTAEEKGALYGRKAPTLEELTKRYLDIANKAKKKSQVELDPSKARAARAEYEKAKKHYDLAVEHYHALMGRHADDALVVADEWRSSIGKVLSKWDEQQAKANAAADEDRVDYMGKAQMVYYGRGHSKDKMKKAMHKAEGAGGAWDEWKLWKLGNGKMVWIDGGVAEYIDVILPKRKGINSKLFLKLALQDTGNVIAVKNTNGKPKDIPVYVVKPKPVGRTRR